jgi:hypothetical protein
MSSARIVSCSNALRNVRVVELGAVEFCCRQVGVGELHTLHAHALQMRVREIGVLEARALRFDAAQPHVGEIRAGQISADKIGMGEFRPRKSSSRRCCATNDSIQRQKRSRRWRCFVYIKVFYNRQQIHTALGGRSPGPEHQNRVDSFHCRGQSNDVPSARPGRPVGASPGCRGPSLRSG